MSFDKLHENRKNFINKNKNNDHIVLKGKNNVLISSPHGVSQIRLGKYKYCEIGSLTTALYLFENSNCFLIAKTQNNNDDANFDEKSKYKNSIENLIQNNKINYIVDIHGLASKRDCDINLGTHLGQNIKLNEKLFDNLYNSLVKNNFITKIDNPFMASYNTISSSMVNKYPNIWAIQIEINCAITNKKENYKKYKNLLNILRDWITNI
ncbi:MAG: hypothetical protein E7359_00590 [Clostridiales bacterium]|nr:hypothetical protein [Clostridiales bacterium]